MVCIGIDLGTTHGCVGVYHNGKVNIIANNQGVRTTACYVAYHENETVVGDAAMEKMHSNRTNTICHFKHALGKDYKKVMKSTTAQSWQFDVSEGPSGEAVVKVESTTETITPEAFCTLLIANLKDLAQEFTGEVVTHVVLTVPTHYSDKQRAALTKAAEDAELIVLRILDESVAAAIAFGLDVVTKADEPSTPEYVVVYNLGGTSHEISLLCVDNGLMKVISSLSGNAVGGETFTALLVEHCVNAFEKLHPTVPLRTNQRALGRLKLVCEAAKRALSQQSRTTIEVDSIMEGLDLIVKVSQSRYEDLIFDSVRATMADIDTVLEQGELDKENVTKVLLVGGCTKTPLIQKQMEKYFDQTSDFTIVADEIIATGASIEAYELFSTLEYDITPQDAFGCMPLSLGLAASNGSMVHILNRETMLPATYTETFTTFEDNQSALFFEVYEGERLIANANTLMAQFSLGDLPLLPKGEVNVHVSFTVSHKGTLTIVATEDKTGLKKTMIVEASPTRLTSDQVDTLIQDAEEAEEEDEAKLAAIEEAALAKNMEEASLQGGNSNTGVVLEEGDMMD